MLTYNTRVQHDQMRKSVLSGIGALFFLCKDKCMITLIPGFAVYFQVKEVCKMKKNEYVMIISIIVLMVTGCLFHPFPDQYNLIRCIHSVAALFLIGGLIVHVATSGRFRKKAR